jgi:transcriptional regulator with XRE-family HTH domain
MATQNQWPAKLTRSVAGQIRRYREHRKVLVGRKWSAQDLAAECVNLGLDVSRDLITDLENGRRSHISVAELFAIAAALEVPPLQLLFGVGTEETVEILPGRHVPAFRAAQWFTGEGPMPEPGDDAGLVPVTDPRNAGPALPLVLYRLADRAFVEEMQATSRARVAGESGFPDRADYWRRAAEESWDTRERARREAEAAKITPPPARMSLRPGDDALIV